MPSVNIHLLAPTITQAEAFARISDFARYPELTETVRSVEVGPPDQDGSVISEWTVRFRDGLLQWSERDTFFPQTHSISFEQVKGDFASFHGDWRVAADGESTLVCFLAAFDLGIPTLAAILDPVAETALRENILTILTGLLGDVHEIEVDTEVAGSAQS